MRVRIAKGQRRGLPSQRLRIAIATFAAYTASLAAVELAGAAIPNATTTVISACYKAAGTPPGNLRVIDRQAGATCLSGEKLLEWKASSVRYRGTWNNTASYIVNDVVTWNGSAYIAKLNNKAVRPTTISAWGLLAAKGATGAAGPAGAVGPRGAVGAKGDVGATGSKGPKGDTGATGPIGPAGAKGATGPQGPSGVVSVSNIFGEIPARFSPTSRFAFIGGTNQVSLAAGQKLTGSISAGLGSSGTALFEHNLCYQLQPSGTVLEFSSSTYLISEVTTARTPFTTSASSGPLSAGTYLVGFCIRAHSGAVTFSDNHFTLGWVMVTN